MKRFRGICIITQDVPRLRHFYCDVLQVAAEGDARFATFSMAGADLALFTEQGMEQMAPHSMQGAGRGGYTLEFEVEDVDQEYQRLLVLNIPIVKPPTTQAWRRRSVWFRDPDGNIVNFYTPNQERQENEKQPSVPGIDGKVLVREYFERLFNKRDLSVCDELLASDYYDHDAPPETPPGPQSAKEVAANFLAMYPNLHVDIEKLVAEENRVAARLVWCGTHAKTGEILHQLGIIMVRLNKRGQLVERWSTYMALR